LALFAEDDDPWLAAGLHGDIGRCRVLLARSGHEAAIPLATASLDQALKVITPDECPWLNAELAHLRRQVA
jgi:hypothetical protein